MKMHMNLSAKENTAGTGKSTGKRIWIAVVSLVVLSAVVFGCFHWIPRQFGKKASIVVDADGIASLEGYKSLSQLDLSGSTCYPEILEYSELHPEIEVKYKVFFGECSIDSDAENATLDGREYEYSSLFDNLQYLPSLRSLSLPGTTLSIDNLSELRRKYPGIDISFSVDIGGTVVNSNETELKLKSGEYSADRLVDFLPISSVNVLYLGCTDLKSTQLQEIAELIPGDNLHYSVKCFGKEFSNSIREIDLSFISDNDLDTASELLRCLPDVETVELMNSQGNAAVSLDGLFALYEANSGAFYNIDFDFYGKRISTSDTEIKYRKAKIGNEGVEEVRKVLPLLKYCKRFVLDDCGIDNEVMATLRDDFPDMKIVWRVHWLNNRYSALTDVNIIRSGSYFKLTDGCGVENLKYCTEVIFADLGHNTELTDVSFLSYWKHIRVLLIDDAAMTSLDSLSNATELQLLEIVKCFGLTDFKPLENCKNLRFINFSNCYDVSDLSPLYGLDKLETVYSMGMHKTKLTDRNQINEIQEKLPDCQCIFTSRPDSIIGGLYSVGWKLESAPNKYSKWYQEVHDIFRYGTRSNGEGIFNYPDEDDSLFYVDEDSLTVFTADRSA